MDVHGRPAASKESRVELTVGRLEVQMRTGFFRIGEFEGWTDCLFLSSLVHFSGQMCAKIDPQFSKPLSATLTAKRPK